MRTEFHSNIIHLHKYYYFLYKNIFSIEFAGGMLYSASFDQTIRSWDLQEMKSRIYEKSLMFFEDIRSRKIEAYLKIMPKKKKKKKGKKAGQKKK